jgi:hypothetical protein
MIRSPAERAIASGTGKLGTAIEHEFTRQRTQRWALWDLRDRLLWLYGPERAAEIMAGRDEATQADIAKWNALGNRGRAT